MNYRTLRVLWKYAREVRSLFRLSLPIMAGLVGQTLMGIADTVMVGQVGGHSVGSLFFGDQLVSPSHGVWIWYVDLCLCAQCQCLRGQ